MNTKQYYFRTLFLILPTVLLCLQVHSQKAVFLHHSTGGNVYNEGKVNAWIDNYNQDYPHQALGYRTPCEYYQE